MALCTTFIKYKQATCQKVSGGIAQAYVFDPADFNFTQAAPTSGLIHPYTAVADLSGGDGYFEPIVFMRKMADYKFSQKSKGGYAAAYTHTFTAQVSDVSMLTAQFASIIDQGAECCGLGILLVLNSGRILVLGENNVNESTLPIPFFMYQDGSSADTGKAFDDLNTNTLVITGDYNRPAIEYTGGGIADFSSFIGA